jgi:hypothetical protein
MRASAIASMDYGRLTYSQPSIMAATTGRRRCVAAANAADTLIADKAFDADARVRGPLAAAGKSVVIPPRPNRLSPPDCGPRTL